MKYKRERTIPLYLNSTLCREKGTKKPPRLRADEDEERAAERLMMERRARDAIGGMKSQ